MLGIVARASLRRLDSLVGIERLDRNPVGSMPLTSHILAPGALARVPPGLQPFNTHALTDSIDFKKETKGIESRILLRIQSFQTGQR